MVFGENGISEFCKVFWIIFPFLSALKQIKILIVTNKWHYIAGAQELVHRIYSDFNKKICHRTVNIEQ